MNKVAHYLQQHLIGEVLTSPDVLRYFSTDESIFEIKPMLVVHPRGENDLRKTARFSWQLAERGRVVPITIKGKGTDLSGASLGTGIILSTPAHMNKIIELDPKSGLVTVEAGLLTGKLQQTLYTHGRFLPSVSNTSEYATIGGAVANNESSSSGYKYGPIREFVSSMRVTLANGELIRTGRISKRELNKKLGLASFEGEIYRSLDKLIDENHGVVSGMASLGDRNNVGYGISEVKRKDGSFDLTPLFVGSQGTLGLVSEITFETEVHNPQTDLIVGVFESKNDAWHAVEKINAIKNGPLSVDFIDRTLVNYVQNTNPSILKNTLDKSIPDITLFIEIEKPNGRSNKKLIKKVKKHLEDYQGDVLTPTASESDSWRVLKDSASLFLSHSSTRAKAVPVVDDAVLPINKCAEFISRAEQLLERLGQTEFAFWGMAGSGVIHTAPLFDVGQIGDRQRMFKLMDDYYALVAEMGGSVSGEYSEGRTRGMHVHRVLPQDAVVVMNRIKDIFDPYGTLNPGVKVNVNPEELKKVIRNEYHLDHQYSHLPRS